MNAVSLFSGVGGFDLALERNGIPVVASVEIDKKARGVLARHFPNAQLFSDVTEVTGGQLRDAGFVPDDGIVTGGFPCQDLSVAGRRAGLAGGRSGLFWEIVRLAAELEPRWLILENVPGLLSSNGGRDMGIVLGALGELGYGFAYRVLDAQYFGVAQRRRRVFIVGCLGDDGTAPGEVLALREGVRGHPAPSRETGQEIAGTLTGGFGERGVDADQIANGNYAIAGSSFYRARGHGDYVGSDTGATLRSRDHTQGTVDVVVQPFVKIVRSGARDENGELPPEVWAERDVAPTLNVMDNTGESRATVLAFGHKQGLDIQPSETAFPTLRLNGDGAAVATLFGDDRRTGPRIHEEVAPTLQSFMGTGGNNVPMVAETTVRRLTPVECERLMGFSDGWTEGQADAPRYKQMGNAVAVPVVEWIVSRIVGLGR